MCIIIIIIMYSAHVRGRYDVLVRRGTTVSAPNEDGRGRAHAVWCEADEYEPRYNGNGNSLCLYNPFPHDIFLLLAVSRPYPVSLPAAYLTRPLSTRYLCVHYPSLPSTKAVPPPPSCIYAGARAFNADRRAAVVPTANL